MFKENLPYYSYRDYLTQKYSEPLFRVPVDLELGCPNRRPDGSGGCTFCPEHGARAVQTLDVRGTEAQLEAGIAFAAKRYNAHRFMLYIQAYTGTFTSVLQQKKNTPNSSTPILLMPSASARGLIVSLRQHSITFKNSTKRSMFLSNLAYKRSTTKHLNTSTASTIGKQALMPLPP